MPKREIEIEELIENANDTGLDLVDIETCDQCGASGIMMIAKLYPQGHTECHETCDECGGDGYITRKIGEWTSAFIY